MEVRSGATLSNAVVVVDIDSGTHLESVKIEFPDSDLPAQIFNVVDRTVDGNGVYIKVPSKDIYGNLFRVPTVEGGTLDVDVFTFGDDGAGANNLGDGSENDDEPFDAVLTVLPGNSSTPAPAPVASEDEEPSWLKGFLAGLIEALKGQKEDDTHSNTCPPVYMGYNRIEVQSWLLTHGYEDGFNSVGIYTVQDLQKPHIVFGSISKQALKQANADCNK